MKSSIDRTEILPPQLRRLDAVARLINGREICTAMAFDTRDKVILIANNSGTEHLLIGEYLRFFQRCAQSRLTEIAQSEFERLLSHSKEEMSHRIDGRAEELALIQQIRSATVGSKEYLELIERHKREYPVSPASANRSYIVGHSKCYNLI